MTGRRPGRPPGDEQTLRVLQSLPTVTEATNPYLGQLTASLSDRVHLSLFTWRRALLGDYDVLHVHWPERLIRGRTAVSSVARTLLFVLTLAVLRLRGRALVRTLHNRRPHEDGPWWEKPALQRCDAATTLWIALNPSTTAPSDAPLVLIPHGHYRDWVAKVGVQVPARVPGRLLFFGLVRRYKGVENLLSAFAGLDDDIATLRLVGRVVDTESADVVEAATASGPRVTARLEFVPDADLIAEIGAGQLVVLPYRNIDNSGAALLALSLDRPILVPDNDVTRALADEVGHAWVLRYRGEVDSAALAAALASTADPPPARPDLSARGWVQAADDHVAAYGAALARTSAATHRPRRELRIGR